MKRKAFILIIAGLMLILCGCRYSDVLQQIIYNMNTDPIDFNNEVKPIDNDPDAATFSESVPQLEIRTEAQRETAEKQDMAKQGEENSPLTAMISEQDPYNTDKENEATNGDADGEESQSEAAVLDNPVASNEATARQVVDAYGKLIELPEQIEKVAAAGEIALMVRMLGGAGCLSASDESFTGNAAVQSVWSDAADIPALWQSGNSYITEENFSELLELKPQLVLENSNQNLLTNAQIGKLQEQGIIYLALPPLSDYTNIKNAVTAVGNMLANDGAAAMAEKYCAYVDSTLKSVRRQLNAANAPMKYTLFIADWDDDAQYTIATENYVAMSGTGAAVTYIGAMADAINAFTSGGGVTNTPSLYSMSRNTTAEYALPIVPLKHSTFVSGDKAAEYCRLSIFAADSNSLGSDNFPAVIAASEHIRSQINANPMWQVYDIVNSADQHFYGRGFLDQRGVIVNSNIFGDFQVYVNPHGLGNWWAGSVESVLQSVWVAHEFFGAVSREELENTITDFYRSFYGYSLSSEELAAILGGK